VIFNYLIIRIFDKMDNDKGMSAENLAEYEMMCERVCNSTNTNVF
jgi:hypothetical protein